MTGEQDTPTRWRPRFSVRTLVVIVTVVCAYAACWGPTKTRGVADVTMSKDWAPEILGRPAANAPLVVSIDNVVNHFANQPPPKREYYLWLFGYVVKLPYETKTEPLPLRPAQPVTASTVQNP